MPCPAGLSMYDIDHINDPEGYFERNVRSRVKELNIYLAHKTPSGEGLRLIFSVENFLNGKWKGENGKCRPDGNSQSSPFKFPLEEAQRRMSEQLGDANYDGAVKEPRPVLVPRAEGLHSLSGRGGFV